MTIENKHSRLAGLLYLITVVTGVFSLMYVPSQVAVPNDPHATINNIIASESLYRYGIASFMVEQVAFLLLPLVLFRLLRQVDQNIAVLMVALAVTGVPLALVSVTHQLDVLSLLKHASTGQAFAPEQWEFLIKQSIDAYGRGLLVSSLFWGLWLFPFGYLVFKSGFLPRILGIFLMLGSLSYVVDVFCTLLVAHYPDTFISNYIMLPPAIGEIGISLWLLLVGVRRPAYQPA